MRKLKFLCIIVLLVLTLVYSAFAEEPIRQTGGSTAGIESVDHIGTHDQLFEYYEIVFLACRENCLQNKSIKIEKLTCLNICFSHDIENVLQINVGEAEESDPVMGDSMESDEDATTVFR